MVEARLGTMQCSQEIRKNIHSFEVTFSWKKKSISIELIPVILKIKINNCIV